MYKLKERLGKEKFNWILLVCLMIQFVLIVFCNFTLSEKNIDCDSAKIYRHTIELWRNKTLVISGWKYASTMVFECAALFAAPIFGVLGNIYYAFAISNIVLMFILFWTILHIFKDKKIIYSLVCANMIFIPYTIGQLDYFNMMFFNYSGYIIKVILPLMLVAALVQAEKKEKLKIGHICFKLLYFFLLIICCFSSGIYIFVSGLFPILIGYCILKYYNMEKMSYVAVKWMTGTVLAVGAGFFLNIKYGNPSLSSAMALCSIYDIKENISSCILGIFELLGGVTYVNTIVFSYQGLSTLIHLCFTLIVIICGICTIVKIIKHQASLEQMLLQMIFVWNFFILCVTDTRLGMATSNYRYHLVGVVPLLCVAGISFVEFLKENEKKYILQGIYLLVLAALMVTSYVNVFQSDYEIDSAKAICEYAKEKNIKTVYIPSQQRIAEICRLLDYENALYLCVEPESEKVVVYDFYQKYENQPIESDNNSALALYLGDYDIRERSMFGHEYKPIEVVADFCIYQ